MTRVGSENITTPANLLTTDEVENESERLEQPEFGETAIGGNGLSQPLDQTRQNEDENVGDEIFVLSSDNEDGENIRNNRETVRVSQPSFSTQLMELQWLQS